MLSVVLQVCRRDRIAGSSAGSSVVSAGAAANAVGVSAELCPRESQTEFDGASALRLVEGPNCLLLSSFATASERLAEAYCAACLLQTW